MLEHMGFGESLLLSVIGIAIVFAVLFALSLFIRAMSAITRSTDRKRTSPAISDCAPAEIQTEEWVPAPESSGEVKLYGVDEATAAMIMAIVADECKLPLSELQFQSIREIKDDSPHPSPCSKIE
ncbi:MAG: OadG family protein [Clostridiales bacterium]|jgi:Na+-transporting methylmalonyl-CoA/oxaloacetate decarboxylase gamma subunit|nr:OadG family protein [Clostridiales bacterium]